MKEELIIRSETVLGWDTLKSHLASKAVSEMGVDYCINLRAKDSQASAHKQIQMIFEILEIGPHHGFQTLLDGLRNVCSSFEHLEKGGVCPAEELHHIGRIISALIEISHKISELRIQNPEYLNLTSTLFNSPPLLNSEKIKIEISVNGNGEILDSASVVLKNLRNRFRSMKADFEETIKKKMDDWDKSGVLQDKFFDVIEGRYVVPVKSGERSRIEGILHDRSNTRQSLYIEPLEFTSVNNAIKEVALEISKVEYEILKSISIMIAPHAKVLNIWLMHLGYFDLILAAARLAIELDLEPPVFAPSPIQVDLESMYYPQLKFIAKLDFSKIVKNNIKLSHEKRALIISGPNTGGKTVLLKAFGLTALLANHGLPIPARRGSKIPFYKNVIALIGDDQSVGSGTSSFSAQIRDLKSVSEYSDSEHNLILVDEILSSTAPDEASALAQSFIEKFIAQNRHIVVTTHYPELSLRLQLNSQVVVSGMEFLNGQPTFKIKDSEIGSSHAIEIAKRLGVSQNLIERAKSLMSTAKLDFDAAIEKVRTLEKGLLDKKADLIDNTSKLELSLKSQFILEKENLERKLNTIISLNRLEYEKKFSEFTEEWKKRLQAKNKIGAMGTKELESSQKKTQNLLAQKTFETIQRELKDSGAFVPKLSTDSSSEIDLGTIQEGSKVRVRSLSQAHAVVLSFNNENAILQVGNFRLEKPISELEIISSSDLKKTNHTFIHLGSSESNEPISDKIDLRGKTVEEALSFLQRALDQAYLSGKGMITVVTGHGTGALKKNVHEFLRALEYIKDFRSEHQGNTGAVIVEFER